MDRRTASTDRDGRMTFTGSNAGQPAGAVRWLDVAPAVDRPSRRPPFRPRVAAEPAARVLLPHSVPQEVRDPVQAIIQTATWLEDHQFPDGHWRGPLEGDTILESEYLLLLAWADRLTGPTMEAAARRILSEQLPSGGWAIYPGGPVDVSASVKAYLALKLVGHDPVSPPLRKARGAIAAAGGPRAVNSFTKFYLALLGQLPYAACPAVPPEIVLLPEWFPVNLLRVSSWSRTMIVPLSLMWAFQPVRPVARERGIAELFADAPAAISGPREGGWARFFRGVDRVMKGCEAVGFVPLRARAVQACRRWMLERLDGSDGLGAIFPPIVWSIIALRALGCDDDAPEVQESWRQLERLVEREPDGTVRLEPCRSPVWDTAISAIGLVEAASLTGRTESLAAAERGIDWLLDHELRTAGDWLRGMAAGQAVQPSGWCFQYANRFYPDIDDTAMVLVTLATWRRLAGSDSPAGRQRLARVQAAVDRAVAWLEAMQSSDGGWGAFDRDNNLTLLCKVPFADHNAMIDPSTADVSGRVLEAFGKLGLRPGRPAVDRGIAYLRASQEPSGSWFGRWGVNYVYGTWQALEGLRAVGLGPGDAAIERGAEWLVTHQQADGGWGESPESYADPGLAGTGPTTASQTAWGIAGLVAAGRGRSATVQRAVTWLLERQDAAGCWAEPEFTGTGFPQVFYLRYHYYRIYFPLVALCRALTASDAPREPSA
jgi:squalene-hopene/tetraprenyl-beta-curcumene cyclase